MRNCLRDHVDLKEFCSIYQAHDTPDLPHDMGVFAFVRHPADWLSSLFTHRKCKGWNWDKSFALEQKCAAKDFKTFIANICSHEGIVSQYFNHYLDKYRSAPSRLFIGKQENLCQDFISALTKFNESFKKQPIVELKDQKANGAKNKTPSLTVGDRDRLYESQEDFYSMYGYEK